jgi:hypothetical protein
MRKRDQERPIRKIVEPKLKPWMKGPFELLKHAAEHLSDGGDTDRRIALIGFDNAIEVSLEVFIRLHPRLRGNKIAKDDAEKSLKNFYEKIYFLERYLEKEESDIQLPSEEILWFHSLRNELYHAGNGMVPELHVIEGAQNAAVQVFEILFNVSLTNYRFGGISENMDFSTFGSIGENGEMEFLATYIEFEKALRSKIPTGPVDDENPNIVKKYIPIRKITKHVPKLARHSNTIAESMKIRNKLVHGVEHGLSDDDFFKLSFDLLNIIEEISQPEWAPND